MHATDPLGTAEIEMFVCSLVSYVKFFVPRADCTKTVDAFLCSYCVGLAAHAQGIVHETEDTKTS